MFQLHSQAFPRSYRHLEMNRPESTGLRLLILSLSFSRSRYKEKRHSDSQRHNHNHKKMVDHFLVIMMLIIRTPMIKFLDVPTMT